MNKLIDNIECKINELPVYELAKVLNISYDFARLLKDEVSTTNILVCNDCILKCPLN
ncbi:MAG: hypothetical protein LBB07_02470 [Bifidobacteriaceae bacterium]|jgi:hypothetical protein|nr:hypothetical protein [Bifidobacteriaceae bacterium]